MKNTQALLETDDFRLQVLRAKSDNSFGGIPFSKPIKVYKYNVFSRQQSFRDNEKGWQANLWAT